jgi:U3 small nucleolar ribonucleoprotein component
MQQIIDELQTHEQTIQRELGLMQSKAAELANQLARIRDAISALNGKSKPGRSAAENVSRVPTDAEIAEMIRLIRSNEPTLPSEELYRRLEAEIQGLGKAKYGLRAKFEKALKTIPSSASPSLSSKSTLRKSTLASGES